MSFNSNPSRVEYVVTTKNKTFTFNFAIFNAEDVMVYKVPVGVTPDDNQHLLTLTDYKVTMNNTAGGFIELYNEPTVGDNIIIQRKLKIDRATDYVNNGGIYSDVLNGDQDYQTYLIGDLQNNQEKFFKIPTSLIGFNTQIPVPKPNGILQISTDGTSMEFNTDIGEHVRNVSNNIDSVNNISNSLPTLNTIEDNLTIIQSISTNMNDVKYVSNNMDSVNNISNSLPTLITIEDNLSNINKVSTNMDDVKLAASYVDKLQTYDGYRADKILAGQNIANMIYTHGDLTKIRYINDNDTNYEVLSYTTGNLSTIDHYIGTVLQGTTTLSYTDGNLVSAIFVGV